MPINDPIDIPDLRFWYDSTDASTIDVTGDDVTEWRSKDTSGILTLDTPSAVNACQHGTVQYNGKDVIQFSNSGSLARSQALTVSLPYTVVCFIKPDSLQNGEFFGPAASGFEGQMWLNADGTVATYDPTYAHDVGGYSTTDPAVAIMVKDSADDYLIYNNGPKSMTGSAGTQRLDKIKLGQNRVNNQPYTGWIGQVICYTRAITDQEASDLYDWILAQYPATSTPPYSDPPHEVIDAGDLAAGLLDPLNIYYGQDPATELTDQFSYQEATVTNGWGVTIDAQGYPVVDTGGEIGTDTFLYQMSHDAGSTWDGVDGTWTFEVLPAVLTLDNETVDETGDGATLTIDSNSDLGTLYSYSKTTAFTGTDEENAAEIIANGVGQAPVIGTNTRVVTGQDSLTPHYAGWVQDSEGYGADLAMEFNMGAGETLTIPAGPSASYLFDIDWGDGTPAEEGLTTEGAGPHTYTLAGDYVVRISGLFPHLYFNAGVDVLKLIEVKQLGDVGYLSFVGAFNGAVNMTAFNVGVATGALAGDASYMMRSCTGTTAPTRLELLDTANITKLDSTLRALSAAGAMDIGIDVWNVEKVTNFIGFLQDSQLTTACYDRTLIAWAAQDLSGVTTDIHFGNSTYTAGGAAEAARTTIIGMIAGTITDGGAA